MVNYKIGIKFDKNFLKSLKNDSNSGVEIQKTKHHLALHPINLNDFSKSIKDLLNKDIPKYNKNLGGLLLGYQNIKLPSDLGLICYDSCYIHVDLEADFFVFKPTIGKEMQGVVNRKSKDHVGLLVYNAFNVSIPKLQNGDTWLGNSVNIGYEVLFTITYIDLSSYLPYIRGELISVISEPALEVTSGKEYKTKSNKKPANKKIIFDDSDETPISKKLKKHSGDLSENTHKSKKRKQSISEEIVEEEHVLDIPSKKKSKRKSILHEDKDNNEQDNEEVSVKKKKKGKHKKLEDEISLEDLNLSELFNESKQSSVQIKAEDLSSANIKFENCFSDIETKSVKNQSFPTKRKKKHKGDGSATDNENIATEKIIKKVKEEQESEYEDKKGLSKDLNLTQYSGFSKLEISDVKSEKSRKRKHSVSELDAPLKKQRRE